MSLSYRSEPISERTMVAAEMLAPNGVIGAMERVLDVSDQRVDPSELLPFDAGWPTDGTDTPLRTGFNDGAEAI
jgi:hypothetical protein